MRATLAAAIGLGLLAAVPAAAAADATISSFTLPNGLTGVVIEDHRAPVVTQMVWYKVGSADDPPGQSGLAHFLEHLMFKATGTLGDGEFSRIVAANGGDDNAFTASDYTAYFQRIAADRLALVMAMEADRMVNLDPGAAGVLAERDVVLEERRQVVENTPDGVFDEARRTAIWLNHPYRLPVIGWEHEIDGFTLDRALAFYRTHYAPNNAILVVAGDVDPAEVERLAAEHFGPIPASDAIPPRVRPQEPPHRAARRLEYRDPRVRQPVLVRSYVAPQRRPGDQEEAAALQVLAELLGGSSLTSAMGRALVVGEDIAIGAGAGYAGLALDPRSFSLDVTPKPGVTPDVAEARLDALIARFLAEGPEPARLDRVKAQMRAAEIYALDEQSGRARRVGAALASGLTLEDVAAWPELLQAVTAEDVMAAARALFRPEAAVTAWMLPADPVAAAAVGQ